MILTASEAPRDKARMARPKNEFEIWSVRFWPGTRTRIDAVLGGRDRASFVRDAVAEKIEREVQNLTRRERTRKPKP